MVVDKKATPLRSSRRLASKNVEAEGSPKATPSRATKRKTPEKAPVIEAVSDDSSDDEAPEGMTLAAGKEAALQAKQSEKEARIAAKKQKKATKVVEETAEVPEEPAEDGALPMNILKAVEQSKAGASKTKAQKDKAHRFLDPSAEVEALRRRVEEETEREVRGGISVRVLSDPSQAQQKHDAARSQNAQDFMKSRMNNNKTRVGVGRFLAAKQHTPSLHFKA